MEEHRCSNQETILNVRREGKEEVITLTLREENHKKIGKGKEEIRKISATTETGLQTVMRISNTLSL